MGLARNKVGQWERRFAAQGLAGLEEAKGRGRKSWLAEDKKAVVITEVALPPKGQARWPVRRMARQAGMSVGTVHALGGPMTLNRTAPAPDRRPRFHTELFRLPSRLLLKSAHA